MTININKVISKCAYNHGYHAAVVKSDDKYSGMYLLTPAYSGWNSEELLDDLFDCLGDEFGIEVHELSSLPLGALIIGINE